MARADAGTSGAAAKGGGKPVKKGRKRKGGPAKDEEFGITRCSTVGVWIYVCAYERRLGSTEGRLLLLMHQPLEMREETL